MVLTCSSLMMDFSIHSRYINSLGNMLTVTSFLKNFQVYFSSKGSFQTGNIKEENKNFKKINQSSYKET